MFGVGLVIGGQRPPCEELLDILKHDDARAHTLGPHHHHPRQVADVALYWGSTLGLAEMLAIGRKPRQPYWSAFAGISRINLPDIRCQVQCVGVVGLVHRQRHRIVVDGNVRASPKGHFNAGRGTATAREGIGDQVVG